MGSNQNKTINKKQVITMSIMNSKERKARNRGRKQGFQMCIDELKNYFASNQAQLDNPNLKQKNIEMILQHLEKTKNNLFSL